MEGYNVATADLLLLPPTVCERGRKPPEAIAARPACATEAVVPTSGADPRWRGQPLDEIAGEQVEVLASVLFTATEISDNNQIPVVGMDLMALPIVAAVVVCELQAITDLDVYKLVVNFSNDDCTATLWARKFARREPFAEAGVVEAMAAREPCDRLLVVAIIVVRLIFDRVHATAA